MTRVLAVLRRLFLGGTVSLLLCLFILGIDANAMFALAKQHNNLAGMFSIFFLAAPIAYVVFTLVSVVYIRKNGQFATVHQSQPWITTLFRCIGSDLASPFKCTLNFFGALFSKKAVGREILVARFLGMLFLIFACLVGMGSLL